jgi:hypothetical protein
MVGGPNAEKVTFGGGGSVEEKAQQVGSHLFFFFFFLAALELLTVRQVLYCHVASPHLLLKPLHQLFLVMHSPVGVLLLPRPQIGSYELFAWGWL